MLSYFERVCDGHNNNACNINTNKKYTIAERHTQQQALVLRALSCGIRYSQTCSMKYQFKNHLTIFVVYKYGSL